MTVMKMYCDHCGKELNDMTDYTCVDIEVGYTEIETDLCKSCYEQLVKVVKDFCQAEKVRKGVSANGK